MASTATTPTTSYSFYYPSHNNYYEYSQSEESSPLNFTSSSSSLPWGSCSAESYQFMWDPSQSPEALNSPLCSYPLPETLQMQHLNQPCVIIPCPNCYYDGAPNWLLLPDEQQRTIFYYPWLRGQQGQREGQEAFYEYEQEGSYYDYWRQEEEQRSYPQEGRKFRRHRKSKVSH